MKLVSLLGVWLFILFLGLGASEAILRTLEGYHLTSTKLQRKNYLGTSLYRKYNRLAFQGKEDYFKGWPAAPVFFDSDNPRPFFLYQAGLRLVPARNLFVPAPNGVKPILTTNSLGFRGSELDPKRSLVVCLGGSQTFGSGADEDTFPAILEKTFNGSAQVLNAGFEAQTLDDHLQVFRKLIVPLHPKAVVYLDHINNFSATDFIDFSKPTKPSLLGRAHRFLYERSILVTLTDKVLGISPMPTRYEISFASNASLTNHKKAFTELMEAAADAKVTLLYIPALYSRPPELSAVSDENYRKIVDKINEDTLELASKNSSIRSCDVRKQFQKPELFVADGIHLTKEGNWLLSREATQCLTNFLGT